MNSNALTISCHLKSMDFTKKLGTWVSHELSQNNKENRFQIVAQHLARHRATPGHKKLFLYRIVPCDEKLCLYMNVKPREEWMASGATAKSRVKENHHLEKIMIYVW